jgi:protein ImuB
MPRVCWWRAHTRDLHDASSYANMCSYMVVCVHLPRFELTVAAGGAEALAGRALAIAPAPGCEPRVGEVSGAAEAFGVLRGMVLGEALARCPELHLVADDPLGVAEEWERVVRALEGIGAALELPRAGLAYFESDGLRGLHGGDEGVIAAARRALQRSARVGAGPTRFCALAAALEVRSRRARIVAVPGAQAAHGVGVGRAGLGVEAGFCVQAGLGVEVGPGARDSAGAQAQRYLASRPVDLLGYRTETAALVEPLTRLGVRTLGELAALGRDAVADRFGAPGALARRLARGDDDPLRTRPVEERLEETLELGEASSGPALERVFGVLVDRLLAHPQRRGRTLRTLTLSARLVEGGTWRERAVLREALSDPRRMRLALAPRLALLPAPAAALRLEAERFGPPEGEQSALFDRNPARPAVRRTRLREAVAQVRAAAGADAALRALCVDPDSRVPERRVIFTPFAG